MSQVVEWTVPSLSSTSLQHISNYVLLLLISISSIDIPPDLHRHVINSEHLKTQGERTRNTSAD